MRGGGQATRKRDAMTEMIDITATDRTASDALDEDRVSLDVLLFSRTYLYALFHKLFGGEPTVQVVEALTSQATREVVDEYAADASEMGAFRELLAKLAQQDPAQLADDAKYEYVRMFVGPGVPEALPWETPYVEKQPVMQGLETVSVRETYARHGFKVKSLNHVSEDHVAIMCNYLWLLSDAAWDAFLNGDADMARSTLEDMKRFMEFHILDWTQQYARAARSGSTAILYPQLIEAFADFAVIDHAFLERAIGWLSANGAKLGRVSSAVPERFKEALRAAADLEPAFIEDNELTDLTA